MEEKNPFLFDKDYAKRENLTPVQIMEIKNNNTYLLTILNNLFTGKGDTALAKERLPQLIIQALSGELYYPDSETGFDSNDLGGKFKFLLLELDKNPEARKIFNKSFFTKTLRRLFAGDSWKKNTTNWDDYKMKSTATLPEYVSPEDSALVGAFNIFVYNGDQLGLDMSKIIDTIVGKDQDGNYILKPSLDLADVGNLSAAVAEQTKIFKTEPVFTEIYEEVHRKRENGDPEVE